MRAADQSATAAGSASWEALGSTVVLRVADPRALDGARAAVERELAAVDAACSRFRADSELSRLNGAGGRPVNVGPVLLGALELALRAAELTAGDVDPTLGEALELCGYDRDWRELRPPQPGASAPAQPPALTARVRSDWGAVSLDRARGRVRVPAGMRLDLGATAKAWAADRAAASAARAARCGVLVALGGDIATCGEPPSRGWLVHVTDDHRSPVSAAGQTLHIRSGGLATSSTAVRRWQHAGRVMHHIIDPATGAPVARTWRTVSVAAASAADANIAATAALVRAAAAPAWLEQLGLPARLVAPDGAVLALAGWPQNDAPAQAARRPPQDAPDRRAARREAVPA